MGIHLTAQALTFLLACLLGAVLALVFDAFRISRIALPTPAAVVFVEDLVFWAVSAVLTFFFLLGATNGQVRVFLFIGEILGAVLYRCTLGVVVMGVSKTIIKVVKAILHFLLRWVFRPIFLVFYHIIRFFLRPFAFLGKILKKSARKAKFSLKIRQRVLYNHCKGFLVARVGRKKGRTGDLHGTEAGEKP